MMHRSAAPILVATLVVAALLPLQPARATHSACHANPWWYTGNVCKYQEDRVAFTCIGSFCQQLTINNVRWRGGTASGTCDPTNNVQKWRLLSIKIKNDRTGATVWQRGATAYKTNCDHHTSETFQNVGLRISEDHRAEFSFEHVMFNFTNFVTPDTIPIPVGG